MKTELNVLCSLVVMFLCHWTRYPTTQSWPCPCLLPLINKGEEAVWTPFTDKRKALKSLR